MMKINLYQIFTDTSNLGSLKSLILKEFGLNTVRREKKQSLKTDDLVWMILMIHGIEEFQELTHCFRKIDWHLHMIKVGESDRNLSSIRYLSKIPSGGLIRNMMENYGILTTIEQTWFKP